MMSESCLKSVSKLASTTAAPFRSPSPTTSEALDSLLLTSLSSSCALLLPSSSLERSPLVLPPPSPPRRRVTQRRVPFAEVALLPFPRVLSELMCTAVCGGAGVAATGRLVGATSRAYV